MPEEPKILRSKVKGAIKDSAPDDKEFSESFGLAQQIELDITKENNRHAKDMLGVIGGIFGHEKCAPINIAAMVLFLGLFVFIICAVCAAFSSPEKIEVFTKYGERGMQLCLTAFAYIFGRSGK